MALGHLNMIGVVTESIGRITQGVMNSSESKRKMVDM